MRPAGIGHCLLFLLCLPVLVHARTAAETDWVAGSSEGSCRGTYVEPPLRALEPGVIDASADNAEYIENEKTTFTGNVELLRENRQIKGDTATLDDVDETYIVEGNVELRQPGLLLRGEKLSGSLFEETAIIDSASFLLHQRRLRGTATRLERTADETLVIENGVFTVCEPQDNTWSVKGGSIALYTQEGYGIARDVSLRIKDVPVGYFPYLRFPIDDSRQSGFLLPSIGQDSDGGTDVAIPYYFNLAPNYDATYTLRSIWKRGVMHEAEFRHMNEYSTNIIAGTFLPSDDEYDGRRTITAGTRDDFDEEDRWMVNVSHRGSAGPWSSRINYTSVSDIDYLRDLGGFTGTDADVDLAMDRGDSPALLRTGSLDYRSQYFHSTLELRSYQELNQVRTPQYEVLPRLSVSSARRLDLGSASLDLSALVQATEFDKPEDNAVTGSRIVTDIEAAVPFESSWGFFIPSLRYVHRRYSLDNTAIDERDDASISTTIATLDTGLVFERRTEIRGRAVLQTLEPRLHVLSTSEDFQDDLPAFDTTLLTPDFDSLFRDASYTGYDRFEDARRVSIGVTSRISDMKTGRQWLKLSAGQAFYSSDRDVTPLSIPGVDPEADTSPVFLAAEAQFGNTTLQGSYEFDTEENRSNRGFVSLRYRSPGGLLWNASYTMTDTSQHRLGRTRGEEETDISFAWPLSKSKKWQLIGRWNYNLDDSQTIESLFGVEYNDCCWKARVVFRRELDEPRRVIVVSDAGTPELVIDRRADSGIYFEFQLKGLASLGGRLENLLRNAIAGYQTN